VVFDWKLNSFYVMPVSIFLESAIIPLDSIYTDYRPKVCLFAEARAEYQLDFIPFKGNYGASLLVHQHSEDQLQLKIIGN